MGITRESLYHKLHRKRRLCKLVRKYNYKKNLHKKEVTKLSKYIENELRMSCEDELYELVSQIAHVRKYIRNMMFEYCGEAAEEFKQYFEIIDDLHAKALQHYYASIKYERKLYITDVNNYKKEFDTFMEDYAIDYSTVYEYLFDFPEESGYTTPPRPSEKIKNKLNDIKDDIDLITIKLNK